MQKIRSAHASEELLALEQQLFGRKRGLITLALRSLQSLPKEERKIEGQHLNTQKQKIQGAIAAQHQHLQETAGEESLREDQLDVTIDLPQKPRGHLHLIPEFIRKVEEVFGRMGFDTAEGPEIETEETNFDLLNFPKDHAARDMQDIFYLKSPPRSGSRVLLRGHTSTVQIHYMRSHTPPFRAIFPGKVYRRDADATHSPMFHQFEGLMIGKDISLQHMKAVMIAAVQELITSNVEFRFRTGYFPFVEPGLEMDMRWQDDPEDCDGTLPSELRRSQWLEIAGCGMVHPQVLKNVGIDPKEWQGFAFGFGVERMLMIKYKIKDLRLFYQGDLRFLQQF